MTTTELIRGHLLARQAEINEHAPQLERQLTQMRQAANKITEELVRLDAAAVEVNALLALLDGAPPEPPTPDA